MDCWAALRSLGLGDELVLLLEEAEEATDADWALAGAAEG